MMTRCDRNLRIDQRRSETRSADWGANWGAIDEPADLALSGTRRRLPALVICPAGLRRGLNKRAKEASVGVSFSPTLLNGRATAYKGPDI
jgi:hypothetical protein